MFIYIYIYSREISAAVALALLVLKVSSAYFAGYKIQPLLDIVYVHIDRTDTFLVCSVKQNRISKSVYIYMLS